MSIFKKMLAVIMAVIVGIGCNIPTIYASDDCAAVLTFIKDDADFNPTALREDGVRVGFIESTSAYVEDQNDTERAVKLKLNYVNNGSLLWMSMTGFTLNPRPDISDPNAFIRMKINMPEVDSEKYFYIRDNNGQDSYLRVTDYMSSSDSGVWTEVEIPVADFYDSNQKIQQSKIFSIGVAWKRSSSTTKTSSSNPEDIYITDMVLYFMKTPEAYVNNYDEGKITLAWNEIDKAQSYRVYHNGELVTETEETTAELEYYYSSDDMNFAVSAVDAYGNESMKSVISDSELNTDGGDRVAYIVHDDNLPTAGYYYCWPNIDQQSSGKYISYETQSDSYSGQLSQKITFPSRLSWGSYSHNYSYTLNFSEYVDKASLTMRIKSNARISGSVLTVRVVDNSGKEKDLGTVTCNSTGKWVKLDFPIKSDASFNWGSVKSVQLVYSGSSRWSSLTVSLDLIQVEYAGNDYTVISKDLNPSSLRPLSTYYIMCEASADDQALFVAYYDKDGKLRSIEQGSRSGDNFVAVIRTDSKMSDKDKIKLISIDSNLRPVYKAGVIVPELAGNLNVNTGNWYRYIQPDYTKISGTALDMSQYLDAPAGKYGFVGTSDDNFVFENGKIAEFWGTNLVGESVFLSKSEIDVLVESIAAAGFNLVRVHHMDADYYSPNIFGSDKNSTNLDSAQMDKFNYLWYKLKEKGIYIMPSLLCARKVTSAMGITDASSIDSGMKIEGMFDPDLIRMQKDYAKALLTYENPYTGTTLATDPAAVMFEIHNECNITRYGENQTYSITSSYYYNQFTKLFTDWLLAKYSTRNAISKAWGETVASSGNIEFPSDYLNKGYSATHLKDCRYFLDYVAKQYHNSMMDFLRDEVKVKTPLAGTNNSSSNNLGDVYENASYDYMDRHQYWSHATNGYTVEAGLVTSYPGSVLKALGSNPFYELAKNNVYGRPMVVSEWQSGLPNIYASEIQMVAASVFKYQGYSSCEFDFLNGPLITENKMGDVFGIMGNPLRYGALPAAAAAYYTLNEADSQYWLPFSEDSAMDYSKQGVKTEPMAFMIGKCGLDLETVTGKKATNSPDFINRLSSAMQSGIYNSSTDELAWNTNDGIFTVNSPYVKSATGFIKGKEFSLDGVKINVGNDFATVSVTSPQPTTLSDSSNLLVTAVAKGRNTGYETDTIASTVINAGKAPILLEQVEGEVAVEGSYDVYVLSSSGQRLEKAQTYEEDGSTVLVMSIGDKTMHYEFVKK